MKYLLYTVLAITAITKSVQSFAEGINPDKKKAGEIAALMWKQSDKSFKTVKTPEKWNDESAVIIAKEHFLSYRKEAIVSTLNYDRYNHYRIKLQSSNAVEKYSEFSVTGSGTFQNLKFNFYAGFKIIKPGGEEIIISLKDMVKEKAELNGSNLDRFKIAIPGLEVNDIIDYYIAEQRVINLYSTKYFSFDPAIFELHDYYPIMHQKITFDVLRRCFINLKSLNGAPDFKLTQDAKNDKNKYSLIDKDRERVDEDLWMHNYRAIPTVKFKVTYASSMAASAPTFIGRPGVLKSKVSQEEIVSFMKYAFNRSYLIYDLSDFMKKYYKSIRDKEELAEKAFYALRFIDHSKYREKNVLNYGNRESAVDKYKFIRELSDYYKDKKIKHEILIGVPRYISGINDLILENELTYMIKVNQGEKPVYLSYFDTHAYYGEIDTDLQGTEVYAVDGLLPSHGWKLKKQRVPVVSSENNKTISTFSYTIDDLETGLLNAKVKKSVQGAGQDYYQKYLTDFYTIKKEEFKSYPEEAEFYKTSKKKKELLLKKRKEYLSERDDSFSQNLKTMLENDLALDIEEVSDFEVVQTGRFHETPEFICNYNAVVKGALKKVGKNYILEVGKLIDEQIQVDEANKTRGFDIYMPYARSYEYNIDLKIPEGFQVQGLEKLNFDVENERGGFSSSAQIADGWLKLKSTKKYMSNFEKKETWGEMLEFIQAADDFADVKVLLKKNG
ncbi:DUF3857 domain-containing protein [Fulvivirga sp. M361]|uniref:DUF3857 domain-containing protein n=1 Tax=Fulvivirga sp. M361 TaxID=2594266 RepID=UPI001179EBCA|nr:DUF3857 domain-containing protein [Fulvivirga sp. M361]TRX58618.1 DUF3857 domain-containing protein [Fulvivirga sp. M361]